MAGFSRINGVYQNGCVRVVLADNTGVAKTGLTPASTGLRISTIGDNEATGVGYTGANIQAIAGIGTYVAPAASSCRFGEVDATGHPGLYEVQFLNTRLTPANASLLQLCVQAPGVNVPAQHYQIDLGAQVDVRMNNGAIGSGSGMQDVNVAAIGGSTSRVTKLAAQLDTQRLGTVSSTTFAPTQFQFELGDVTDSDTYPVYINSGFEVITGALQGYKSTILSDQIGSTGRRFLVPALTGPSGGPWLANGDQILIG